MGPVEIDPSCDQLTSGIFSPMEIVFYFGGEKFLGVLWGGVFSQLQLGLVLWADPEVRNYFFDFEIPKIVTVTTNHAHESG